MNRKLDLRERFLSFIAFEPMSGCWLWTGATDKVGYGKMKINNKMSYTHRVSYELFKGEIPEGLTIDHKCNCKGCQNPDHLQVVTLAENTYLRMERRNGSRNVCPHGHAYTKENKKFTKRGSYRCGICHNLSYKRHRVQP